VSGKGDDVGQATTARLSRLRREILRCLLLHRTRLLADENVFRLYERSGIPLRWFREDGYYKTRADSAAFSRALRRLEARGLVPRVNATSGCPDAGGYMRQSPDQAHTRTDHVLLTEAGIRAGETVNKNRGCQC
jgi:hypothetical protein